MDLCGGNVEGTWKVEGVCADWHKDPASTASCPTASSVSNVQTSGTMTYADGTYSTQLVLDGTVALTFPASCITGVTSCASLDSVFTTDIGYESGSCSGDPKTSCTCNGRLLSQPIRGSGTYTTSGTALTRVLNGKTETAAFCVQGNTLSIQETSDKVTNTITATKQ